MGFIFRLTIVSVIALVFIINSAEGMLKGKQYGCKLDTDIDVIDIDKYLKNKRAMDLQIKCVLYGGPCDSVGRWAKPRIGQGTEGKCVRCSEKQKKDMAKVVDWLKVNRPLDYAELLIQFPNGKSSGCPDQD